MKLYQFLHSLSNDSPFISIHSWCFFCSGIVQPHVIVLAAELQELDQRDDGAEVVQAEVDQRLHLSGKNTGRLHPHHHHQETVPAGKVHR